MSHLSNRLLTAAVLLTMGLASCATEGQTSSEIALSKAADLVIDLDRGIARTATWQAPVEDCSNSEFNCLRIDGRADLAFPKLCAAIARQIRWKSPIGEFRIVSQAEHFGLPYGSYISEKYPKALLFYTFGVGYSELRIVNRSPFEATFDPNIFSERYKVKIKGQSNVMLCD